MNSASSVVMITNKPSAFYGEAKESSPAVVLSKGEKVEGYIHGKVMHRTYDSKFGGWRRSSARKSEHSVLAMKLIAWLGR